MVVTALNDDITQEDNMRRQILLSLRSTSSSRSYTLQFDFENTDVDWLVLSETRLCEVPFQGMYIKRTAYITSALSIYRPCTCCYNLLAIQLERSACAFL